MCYVYVYEKASLDSWQWSEGEEMVGTGRTFSSLIKMQPSGPCAHCAAPTQNTLTVGSPAAFGLNVSQTHLEIPAL